MPESIEIRDTPEIRQQLSRLRESNSFKRRRKLLLLLEYLVSETIAGHAHRLTQNTIAADFLSSRSAEGRSSQVAVRILASRLRNALDEYYRKEAEPDQPRIYMPARSYFIAVEEPHDRRRPESGIVLGNFGDRGHRSSKKISQSDILGSLGVNLIQKRCLEMGFLCHATGLEAGIDGYIEIRLGTGVVTNCIIQVQSKATDKPFDGETDSTFEYRCHTKDLDYWLAGNAPVILVRSRPRTDEVYWVSLKEYFSDPAKRKTGKVIFNKATDRFDPSASAELQRIAMQRDSGLYLGTRPKPEAVHSNLLELSTLPKHYYVAATDFRTRGEMFARLRELQRNVQGEWVLSAKTISSFHDLSEFPWTKVCDRGSVDGLSTDDWAQTKDPARQREFVRLLNACLRETLYMKGVRFSRQNQCYYFRAPQDLANREYVYQSRENRTSRLVFRGYPKKYDNSRMSYYRHSAFQGRFVRYGSTWYLQITPTYYFTRDGVRVSRFAPDLISGIKRLENNQAVHGQVVMWAHMLTESSLFDAGPRFLNFRSLLDFELPVGLDDDAWLKHEDDPEKRAALEAVPADERQGSFVL